MLNSGPVAWRSKRQDTDAMSTCEADYAEASEATKRALWVRSLLDELGYCNGLLATPAEAKLRVLFKCYNGS